MLSFPNILLIDDNEQELESIKNAFFEAGMPCLPIHYKNNEPDNESGLDHISLADGICPRVVISDLNLTEIQKADPVNLMAPLGEMLRKLPIQGPYILIIWSKLDGEVDEVMALLEERYKDKLTFPVHYSVISKSDFMHAPQALREKVRELFHESPVFDAIISWEGRISEAARQVTNTLFEMTAVNANEGAGESRVARFQSILASIGNEALGPKDAKNFPALAMDYGLNPILLDRLNSVDFSDLDNTWSNAAPKIGQRVGLSDAVKSKLNKLYHLEEVPEDYPGSRRGVFVELNRGYISEENNRVKFENRIGRSLFDLLHDEFISGSSRDRPRRDRAREDVILGFLEISAECDFAQKKIKLPKYILGALIPGEYEDLTIFKNGDQPERDRSHQGIYRLPKVELNGKVYIPKFSFRYQFGTQPEDNKWFDKCLFRVREQILSSISFSCSQYASRPGIVCFY